MPIAAVASDVERVAQEPVFNAVIGLRQEAKAAESVRALAQVTRTIARVRRVGLDDPVHEVHAGRGVPGGRRDQGVPGRARDLGAPQEMKTRSALVALAAALEKE